MKTLIFIAITFFSSFVSAAVKNCGVVSINKVLTGPRHGAMMQVSNSACGYSGWVCLDPNGETMSRMESDRLFDFILAHKMANKKIALSVHTNVFASGCGGNYPVLEDVRTP